MMTDQELENIIIEKTREGLRFGKGWFPLAKDLYNELIAAGWDGNFTCAKEKYGTIEFYLVGHHPALEAIIEKYQIISTKTCETCGQPGRPMRSFSPVCATHYLDHNYDLQKQFVNHRHMGHCLVCGHYSVEAKECWNCHLPQWNDIEYSHWTKDEFIRTYQVDWYSFIKDIGDRPVSPLEKVADHRVLATQEEINNYVYISVNEL